MSRAPDPAAVARFRADLEAALRHEPGEGPLALAVSGGADSMAMLALAHSAFPGRIAAATVDHRLREASAQEAAMVAAHCRALGVPHETLVPAAPIAGASVQAQARRVRYALLLRWAHGLGAQALLTAHHADDQAETFLMRAARGSGVAGLAGIRARRELAGGLALLRPLLGWRRATLRAIAEATATPFADDPGNADPVFDRARFRLLVERNADLHVEGIAAAAAHAAEAEQVLQEMADFEWIKRYPGDGADIALDMAGLPRELRRRLARRAIRTVHEHAGIDAPGWTDAANIEHLLDALESGGGATRAGVMARARGTIWRFRPAPARRSH